MQHGKDNEEEARKRAMDVLDSCYDLVWKLPGNFVDYKLSLTCSPDAMAFDPKYPDRIKFGLEIKCPFSRPLPKSVHDVGADNALQCFVSLYVTGAQVWYLFYWEKWTGCYSLFRITRNQAMFDKINKKMNKARFKYMHLEDKKKQKPRHKVKDSFNEKYVDTYDFIVKI